MMLIRVNTNLIQGGKTATEKERDKKRERQKNAKHINKRRKNDMKKVLGKACRLMIMLYQFPSFEQNLGTGNFFQKQSFGNF